MLKTQYYDPVYVAPKKIENEKLLKEKDEEAKQILFYNRFFVYLDMVPLPDPLEVLMT